MEQYLDLVKHIKNYGAQKGDRTGTGTISVFGYQMRFDLSEGFPLVTTKRTHLKSIIHELLWFLKGDTNISYLKEHNVKIWDEWAVTQDHVDQFYSRIHDQGVTLSIHQPSVGDLGPVYGKQWRSWACPDGSTIDQIAEVIHLLKTKPDSRRMIVSAWNPADLPDETVSPVQNAMNGKAALPACHTLFQFYSNELSQHERTLEACKLPDMGELYDKLIKILAKTEITPDEAKSKIKDWLDVHEIPTRKLSCQLYIR